MIDLKKMGIQTILAGRLVAVLVAVLTCALSSPFANGQTLTSAQDKFITAITKGNTAQIKTYLKSHPGSLNAKLPVDYGSESPLALAAVCGNWKSFQFLLSRGARINKKTFMTYAGMGANAKIARYIASKGADPNGMDFMGRTALWHVVYHNDLPNTKLFLSLGVSPNVAGKANVPIVGAIQSNRFEMVKLLLSKGAEVDPNWDIWNQQMKTLVTAAIKDKPQIAARFIAKRQNLDRAQQEVRPDEIALEGRVDGYEKTTATLMASRFHFPSGKTGQIEPVKIKKLIVPASTVIQFSHQEYQNQLRKGVSIRVVGKDEGSGKPLTARRIVVTSY